MPSIPEYNLKATNDINRAKRRIVDAEKAGIANLTTRPAVDVTNGKADDLAEVLIKQLDNLILIYNKILTLESIGIGSVREGEPEDEDAIRERIRYVLQSVQTTILATRLSRRILRLVNSFVKVIQFTDLEKINTIKTYLEELGNPLKQGTLSNRVSTILFANANEALNMEDRLQRIIEEGANGVIVALEDRLGEDEDLDEGDEESSIASGESALDTESWATLDERVAPYPLQPRQPRNRQNIYRQRKVKFHTEDFLKIVDALTGNTEKIYVTMQEAFYNFNAFRQQKLPKGEEEARQTPLADRMGEELIGEGKRKVYSIGNKVLDAMYTIEGLPKYL